MLLAAVISNRTPFNGLLEIQVKPGILDILFDGCILSLNVTLCCHWTIWEHCLKLHQPCARCWSASGWESSLERRGSL